jgi:squalene-hopene/tetraprenyl-beta-curcumene cyclase
LARKLPGFHLSSSGNPKRNKIVLRFTLALLFASSLAVGSFAPCRADDQRRTRPLNDVVQRGLSYLRDKGQDAQGAFSPRMGSGITSLAVAAALRHGAPLDDPLVARGLQALERYVQPDGGVYGSDRLRNYETCVAIMALAEANRAAGDGRYDALLKRAEAFVRGLQIGADGKRSQNDPEFGGVGYSGQERPDLSNTGYLLEALHALGAPDDDPAIQRALVFVARCQNLEGHGNDTRFAGLVKDGGFYYVVPTENVDPSVSDRYTAAGGLRSYGSMTYTGFKSLVYAGLTRDDPRAQAALEWIARHYTLTENPGQGTAGLFYYYHTFGSALGASGLDEIAAPEGPRVWRQDLLEHLAGTQRDDGSWTNSNRQWFEDDPNLCTAFALLALAHCRAAP